MKRLLKKRTSLQDTTTHTTVSQQTSTDSIGQPPLASPSALDTRRPSLDNSSSGNDFGFLSAERPRDRNVPPSAYMGTAGRPWGLGRLKSWKGKKRDASPGPGARSPVKDESQVGHREIPMRAQLAPSSPSV